MPAGSICAVGVQESAETLLNVEVYPNLANDHLNFRCKGSWSSTTQHSFINLLGEQFVTDVQLSADQSVLECDVHALDKGVYLVQVDSQETRKTFRLVKN